MLAKKLGARKAIVLINAVHMSIWYRVARLILPFHHNNPLALRQLTHVRRADIANVYSLRRGSPKR